MENELTCQLCSSEFREDNLPRVLTMCGHTFCQKCIDTLISQNEEGKFRIVCPEDGQVMLLKSNQMSNFPKNISLFKVIQAKKNSSNSSFRDESLDMSKIAKKEQPNEDDDANELITAINQSNAEHSISKQKIEQSSTKPEQKAMEIDEEEEEEDTNICLLHQKVLDVVCMVDLQKICAKCAIFGKHKGHDCKSIEEIQKQSKQYHQQIIKIYTNKEAIVKRISNQDNRIQIFNLLKAKQAQMKKQITQKYKKIIQRVKKLQEDSLKSVDELAMKTQTKMKELLQIDKPILDEYDRWQTDSYQQLMTIQTGAFQAKLELMYGGQSNLETTLDKGNKIVAMIEEKEEKLVEDVQQMIGNIGVSFKEEKLQGLQKYVEVYDGKPQEKQQNHKIEDIVHQVDRHELSSEIKIDRGMRASYEESLLQLEVDSAKNILGLSSPIFEPQYINPSKQKQNYTAREVYVEQSAFIIPKFKENQVSQIQTQNISQKYQKPNKKKLKSIKVPQKLEKVLDQLYCDSLQTLDLTNAELGDAVILQISQFLRGSKVKTVKFIRNKLTDECISKLIPTLSNVVTLNLSQNVLTEHTINILAMHRQQMPHLKSVILSQNKIIERKHKLLLDKLRSMDLTVSV